MATDTAPPPPPPALAHDPSLSADYLNCMVWRYLQEAGFSSAAVHLQREWYSDPLSLPIAQYVGPHQLEKLCHHGLLYRNILRRLDETPRSSTSRKSGTAPRRWSAAPLIKQARQVENALADTNSVPTVEQVPASRSTERRRTPRSQTTIDGISRKGDPSATPDHEPARKRRKTSEPGDDDRTMVPNGVAGPAVSRSTTEQRTMEDRAEAKQRAESLAATSEPPEEREIPRPAVVDQAIQGVDIPILDVQDRALIIPRAGDGPESVAWVPRASGVQHWHDNETLVSVGDGEGGAVFDIRHDHAGGGLDVESLPVASHPSTGVRYEMVSCHHMQYDALTACLSFNGKIQVRSNHRHPEFLECPAGFLATGMRWHPDEALLIVFGISPTASLSSNETTSGETENPTLVLFDLADIYDSYYKSTFVQLKTTFNGSMIQDACWAGSKHPRFSIFAVTDHQLHRLEFDRELNTLHDGVVRQNEELAYQGLRPLISNNDQLIALVNIRSNGSLELGVGQGSVEYASRDETFEGIIECSKDPHEVIIDAQWKHGKLKEGILENSAQIIVALHSGIVQIWNVSEAEPGQTALSNLRAEQLIRIEANGIPSGLPVKEIHSITCIDLSKDDRFLAVGSIENALLIWDLADVLAGRTVDPIAICRPVDSVFKEEQSSINDDALKWSPSGHLIAHKVGSMISVIPFDSEALISLQSLSL